MISVNGLRATALRAMGALFVAAVVVGCGGGQQVVKFAPTRIVAFGDETSVITSAGLKYTVNGVSTTSPPNVDCALNPLWIQILATNYSLVFPQCNPNSVASPSLIEATVNATVADVQNQIDTFLAAPNTLSANDLVTVLAGMHDVLNAYAQVKAGAMTEEQATAVVEQAGSTLASEVNALALAGGKVLISTIIDVGTTPFGVGEGATNAAMLSRLSTRFNSKLRIGLINDGHMIGLILTDETFSGAVKNVSGFVNVTDPVCAAPLPTCSTSTLVTANDANNNAPSGNTWLWADSLHLSAGGQSTLGSLAVTRATGNPF